jgi:hypothetical protein
MAVQLSNRRRREKERKRIYGARKTGPVDVSAKIASQQMKHAKYDCTYKAQEHVKESDAEKKRNTHHSTKTAQQAGPVDVSAKIASQQMKRAKINRTYKSKKHVKERLVENQRNKCHSTKAAQQAADEHGVIVPTKTNDIMSQSTCENMGQNYCTEEERKLMVIAVTTVVRRISAPISGTPWNSRMFQIPKFKQTHSPR